MGQSNIIHNFNQSLSYSETAGDEPFWNIVYHKAFPTIVNHMLAGGDTTSQRMGIDRVVILSNGQILRIEEKKRATVYPDILLEYISVDTTGALGWIEKDLAIDYLAYAFMPTKKVYLFLWLLLRRAWINNKEEWLNIYPTIEAKNVGYKTLCKAIPIDTIMKSVSIASVIQL